MGKNRVFFIDALRAFAITAVILGHFPIYCYGGDRYTVLTEMVMPFHMPLFMMISGYVTDISKFSLVNRLKILIPFFIVGLSYTYMTGGDIITFFTSESKNGYWFLWVIVIFFAFLHFIRSCGKSFVVSIILVEGLLIFLHFIFRRTLVGTTISTDYLWQMWPAFAGGVLLRDDFLDWIKNKYVYTIIGALFIGLSALYVASLFSNEVIHKLAYISSGIPLSLSLMTLFVYLENKLKGIDFWGKKALKYIGYEIGTQTLQIYTLHYFILYILDLQKFVSYMNEIELRYIVLLMSPILAFIIACICVLLAKLIYSCRLGFIFGR